MTDKKKPMDQYSAYMDIPFDVAAYCRGHKFLVEAVNLSRAIRHRQQADEVVTAAEKKAEQVRESYQKALAALRARMETKPL